MRTIIEKIKKGVKYIPLALAICLNGCGNPKDQIVESKESILSDKSYKVFYAKFSSGKEQLNIVDPNRALIKGLFRGDTLYSMEGISTEKDYQEDLINYYNPDSVYSVWEKMRK